jgi:hypothetical protein
VLWFQKKLNPSLVWLLYAPVWLSSCGQKSRSRAGGHTHMEWAVRGLVLVQPQGRAVALHPVHPVHYRRAPTVQSHCTLPVHFRHRNLPGYRIPVPPDLVLLASYRRPLRQQRPVAPVLICWTAERQQLCTFTFITEVWHRLLWYIFADISEEPAVYFQTSVTYHQRLRWSRG